jgi:dolichol-phosphate mannosyltransferase
MTEERCVTRANSSHSQPRAYRTGRADRSEHVSERFGYDPGLVSVVVCAYDEAECLEQVIEELTQTLESLLPRWEVVMVDDGSRDGTAEIADRLAAEIPNIRAVHHATNRGHGEALLTGFRESRGEWITSVPGDGQANPEDLARFLPLLEDADMVTSYYLDRDDGLKRTILSKGLRAVLHLLFGRIPRMEGSRFFRRKMLDTIPLGSATFLVNLELVIQAHRQGYRIAEVGAHCRPRIGGETKTANSRTVLKVLAEIFRLRLRLSSPAGRQPQANPNRSSGPQ